MIETICNSVEYLIRKYEGIKRRKRREEEEDTNLIYINGDLLEELLLWLPLKSLCRFKTVSKEWKSILESKRFVERHLNLQKSGRKRLLLAYNCGCQASSSLLPKFRRFEGGGEFVYLHCDSTRPSMSCDGLVCFPEAECIYVLNPSTEELWRFRCPPLLNPLPNSNTLPNTSWSTYFPGNCVMGFGRDIVNGCYKVVRISNDPNCRHILDVNTGQWQKLRIPQHCRFGLGRISVCVNGSIYWLLINSSSVYNILSLDLHTKEFNDVPCPLLPNGIMFEAQIINIEDRLAIAMPVYHPVHKLEIWTMDPREETWSKTHSICLSSLGIVESRSFTPVTLSKEGNVVFYDNKKTLFKYYSQTQQLHTISQGTSVITPYLNNLVAFQAQQQVHFVMPIPCIRRYLSVELRIEGIVYFNKIKDQVMTWLRKNKIVANVLIFTFLWLCPGISLIRAALWMSLFNLSLFGYSDNWIRNMIMMELVI